AARGGARRARWLPPAGPVPGFRSGAGGGEMVSMTSRLGASRMFTDLAREVAPVNPDLGRLAEVGARHGLKVAGERGGGALRGQAATPPPLSLRLYGPPSFGRHARQGLPAAQPAWLVAPASAPSMGRLCSFSFSCTKYISGRFCLTIATRGKPRLPPNRDGAPLASARAATPSAVGGAAT